MTAQEAASLATHINLKSDRFTAATQPFLADHWVLIREIAPDSGSPYIEPILDVRSYLDRAERRHPLPSPFRRLLEGWLAPEIRPDPPSENKQMFPKMF